VFASISFWYLSAQSVELGGALLALGSQRRLGSARIQQRRRVLVSLAVERRANGLPVGVARAQLALAFGAR
jgi:hypothetical protein